MHTVKQRWRVRYFAVFSVQQRWRWRIRCFLIVIYNARAVDGTMSWSAFCTTDVESAYTAQQRQRKHCCEIFTVQQTGRCPLCDRRRECDVLKCVLCSRGGGYKIGGGYVLKCSRGGGYKIGGEYDGLKCTLCNRDGECDVLKCILCGRSDGTMF